MRVRPTIIAGAVAVAAVSLLGFAEHVTSGAGVRDTVQADSLHGDAASAILVSSEPLEDEPGFDCTQHGNGICGTPVPEGIGPVLGCLPSVDMLDWTCTPGFPTRYWALPTDLTVCYAEHAPDGAIVWRSEYQPSGQCTFGA